MYVMNKIVLIITVNDRLLTRTLCVTRFTSDKASPTTNPKTLTTIKLTLMRECYCESRSLIDENNGSAGRSWIFCHHGIAPKVFLQRKCSFYLKNGHFHHPASI